MAKTQVRRLAAFSAPSYNSVRLINSLLGRERVIAMTTVWRIIQGLMLLPAIGGALLLLFELLNFIDDTLGFDFI